MSLNRCAVAVGLFCGLAMGVSPVQSQGLLPGPLQQRSSWTLLDGSHFEGKPLRLEVDNVTIRADGDSTVVNGVEYQSLDSEEFVRSLFLVNGQRPPSGKATKRLLEKNGGEYSSISIIIEFDQDGKGLRLPAAMLAANDQKFLSNALNLFRRNWILEEQRSLEIRGFYGLARRSAAAAAPPGGAIPTGSAASLSTESEESSLTVVRTREKAAVNPGDVITVRGTGLYDGEWTVLQMFPYKDPRDPERLWGYHIEAPFKGMPPGFDVFGRVPENNKARLTPSKRW